MRRVLIGMLIANAVIVACGTEIDTSITTGAFPNDDSGTSPLSEGGNVGIDDSTALADTARGPDCVTTINEDYLDTDHYDAAAVGWAPTFSSGNPSNMGIQARPLTGGIPPHLHFESDAGTPAFVQRDLASNCNWVKATLRFRYSESPPSFDLLSIGLSGATGPKRRLVISYDGLRQMFTASSLDPSAGADPDAGSVPSGTTVLTTARQFYLLHAVFHRTGAIWAAVAASNLDAGDEMPSVDTLGPPLVAAAFTDNSAVFSSLRVGVDNVNADGNQVDLDSITITREVTICDPLTRTARRISRGCLITDNRTMRVLLAACVVVVATGCTVESKFANPKPAVHVAIAHDGVTSINGKAVTPADLTTQAHALADSHFVVDAEREVSFQVLVGTLERLRAGGANDIALGVILGSSDPTAKAAGTPTGPATGPTPPPRATITPGTKWDCPFPTAGGEAKKDANVLVVVHVEPDGKPVSADVLEDPGSGFGDAAKKCALEKSYVAAHDVNGQPIRAATFPFYIHFVVH